MTLPSRRAQLMGFPNGPLEGGSMIAELDLLLGGWEASASGQPETVQVVSRTSAYKETISVRTDDGYSWVDGHLFSVHGGQVVVLIPRALRWTRREGYVFDRLPRVYATEGVVDTAAVAVLARVVLALRSKGNGRR